MIKYRLTVEDVIPSGTELADTVNVVLTIDGIEAEIRKLYEIYSQTSYRVRMVEITISEQHRTVLFKRATQDTPFVS